MLSSLEDVCKINHYIDTEKCVEKYEVISVEGKGKKTIDKQRKEIVVNKSSNDIEVLFASRIGKGLIDFKPSYFNKIYSSFANNNKLSIFHAGMPSCLYDKPFRLKSMEIYNEIETNILVDTLINQYGKGKLIDALVDKSILYSIFLLIKESNRDTAIDYLFEKFLTQLKHEITPMEKVYQDESKLIEYKSRDDLSKKDEDIVKNIISDLVGKTENNLKIFIYGVEDKGKTVEPLEIHKFDSGRVGGIQDQLRHMFNGDLYFIQVPLNDQRHCIFLLLALESTNTESQFDLLESDILQNQNV
jgi:hypothetical protein